jgi:hypothetical protein
MPTALPPCPSDPFAASPSPIPPSSSATDKLPLHRLVRLSATELDGLVNSWLRSLGFHSVRLWERRGFISTYEARFGEARVSVPARIRVHQKLRHLQIPHVESFLGHLVRSGSSLGVLVTTGDCSWAAGLGARTPTSPYLRLCGGAEWAEELRTLGLVEESRSEAKQPATHSVKRMCSQGPERERNPLDAGKSACRTPVRESEKASSGTWHGNYRLW